MATSTTSPTGGKTRSRIGWVILVLAVALIVIAVMRFNLTALQPPGPMETRLAVLAKRSIIRRESRDGIPPRPSTADMDTGATQYGLNCSVCHGNDGRAQTSLGDSMYPRVSDLTSKRVQSYSDRELYWIIQNGIRFTGMPAFAKVETPDQIWDLVNYVRTLPGNLRSENSTIHSGEADGDGRYLRPMLPTSKWQPTTRKIARDAAFSRSRPIGSASKVIQFSPQNEETLRTESRF